MITALRGMKDIIDDAPKFERILRVASGVAKKYGFEFVKTPLLEETALFKRSVGESSDIVGKEMYQFIDKGGNDVCLRPEGTAGVVRAFVEKKLDKAGLAQKFFYHGAMFRYERPQKGRLRQFHQFGCESFGESSVYEDAQMILLVSEIFGELGIGFGLQINSLGCKECMPAYRQKLVAFLANQSEICDDCKRRCATNPIRVLDCKNENCQKIYENAPLMADHLCASCQNDFEKLKILLKDIGFTHNKKLVRGLDYYNKTAFEFVSSEIGAQSAIAGGGRYDTLIEQIGGKPTPAVGFAIGIERIYDLVEIEEPKRNGFVVGALEESCLHTAFELAQKLRANQKVSFINEPKSLKNLLKNADRQNAEFCAVIGENEQKSGTIWVKNLADTKEFVVAQDELIRGNK